MAHALVDEGVRDDPIAAVGGFSHEDGNRANTYTLDLLAMEALKRPARKR